MSGCWKSWEGFIPVS